MEGPHGEDAYNPAMLPRRLRPSLLLATASILLAATADPAYSATLAQRISAAVQVSKVGSLTRVRVFDAASGRVVYAHRAGEAVVPASNQKLLVTATALRQLGPNHRFTTAVALRGKQTGARFDGDVYLVGGGDPTLSTPAFASKRFGRSAGRLDELARALRSLRINRIRGRLVVDESRFDRRRFVSAWPARFRYDECPALGALTVNRNYVRGGVDGGARAPAVNAGAVFRRMLAGMGTTISGSTVVGVTPDTATTVGTTQSPPLRTIVRYANTYSDNFSAEILLKNIGAEVAGSGTTAAGAAVVRRELLGMGVYGPTLRVVDGSGLASQNRISATGISSLLQTMEGDDPAGWAFRTSLAVSGRSGTLQNRMERWPYRRRVTAKTGTLNQTSALSGYALRASSSRRFGFSIVQYSHRGRVSWTLSKRLQDRIAMILVS